MLLLLLITVATGDIFMTKSLIVTNSLQTNQLTCTSAATADDMCLIPIFANPVTFSSGSSKITVNSGGFINNIQTLPPASAGMVQYTVGFPIVASASATIAFSLGFANTWIYPFQGPINQFVLLARENTVWTSGDFVIQLWNSTGVKVFESATITPVSFTKYTNFFDTGSAMPLPNRIFIQKNLNLDLPFGPYVVVAQSSANVWSGSISINAHFYE
jgi:hypothetical protein